MKSAMNPMTEEWANYWWCLHCEKVHTGKAWEANDWWCPGEGCDGSLLDAIAWKDWPRQNHPEYPKVPKIGVYYPLY